MSESGGYTGVRGCGSHSLSARHVPVDRRGLEVEVEVECAAPPGEKYASIIHCVTAWPTARGLLARFHHYLPLSSSSSHSHCFSLSSNQSFHWATYLVLRLLPSSPTIASFFVPQEHFLAISGGFTPRKEFLDLYGLSTVLPFFIALCMGNFLLRSGF